MKWLDPITWFGSDGYNNLVRVLVNALFDGTVARVFSFIFLILGIWFVYRRKQHGAGIGLVCVSVLIIFGKSIMMFLGI